MMALRSPHPTFGVPRGVRVLYAAVVVFFLAFTVHAVTNVGGNGLDPLFEQWISDAVPAGCALICFARARRVRAERTAWASIGLGIALWATGDVYYSLFLASRAVVPIPSVADILWLGEYPVSALGVLLLMRSRHAAEDARAWLDGSIVGLALSAAVAAVVLPSVLTASSDAATAEFLTNIAYPVGDMILLGSIGAALAVRHWRFSRMWTGLALGFGAFALSDGLFLVKTADGTYVAGTVLDAGWLLGGICLAAAAWQPIDSPVTGRRGRFALLLPSAFGSMSLLLLIWDHFERLTTAALLLSSASVAAALARMTLALAENLRMVARLREEAHALSVKNDELLEIDGLKESLRQAQKMEALGQLAGGVAHDFNNLLTVISGYTALLRSKARDDDGSADKLDAIATAAERANDLTRQLLTFSPGQIVQTSEVDLNKSVRETEGLIGSTLGDIRLELQLADGLPAIRADAGQISQVLLNLVLNARDALSGAGVIGIATKMAHATEGEFVELTVADTGSGIDPETQARIFEPFFSTKGKDGTGLGLATAYGIVEAGGGSIAVDSTLGVGTTFTLRFPAAPDKPAAHVTAPDAGAFETLRILLVEDERAVRELLIVQLESLGHRVVAAATPIRACELYEPCPDDFDVVVTDVVMPEMDGWQLTTRLRAVNPDVPVVLMSGYTDGAVDMLEVGGATAFLQKPFGIDELAENIRAVIARRAVGQPALAGSR
jgi:signal transduction histidine kinase/ActR/RegA family two-component response regulator